MRVARPPAVPPPGLDADADTNTNADADADGMGWPDVLLAGQAGQPPEARPWVLGARHTEVCDRLAPDRVRAVSALLERAARADGGGPAVSEQAMLILRGNVPRPATHVLLYADTELVGYGQVERAGAAVHPSAEFVVCPEHRRRGHGLVLGRALLTETDGRMRVWAHGGQPAVRRLARRLRLTLVRELLQLRCLTDELTASEPRLPSGVSVRAFQPGADDSAWLAVNTAAFSAHPEQGALTQADLDARKAEPWFDPEGFFLAVRDGSVVGFAWAKVHAAERLGEGYAAGILPTERGTGLGAALYATLFRHLARHPAVDTLMGYVDADNVPSLRLTERLGLRTYASDLMFRAGEPR